MSTLHRVETDAREQFNQGWYCSEAVLRAVARAKGVSDDDLAKLTPLATGFGAGLSRTSGLCGALAGGVLALGYAHGRTSTDEAVDTSFALTQELLARFRKLHGHTDCSQLLGCDLSTQEGQKAFAEQKLVTRCEEFAGTAARLVFEVEHDLL